MFWVKWKYNESHVSLEFFRPIIIDDWWNFSFIGINACVQEVGYVLVFFVFVGSIVRGTYDVTLI